MTPEERARKVIDEIGNHEFFGPSYASGDDAEPIIATAIRSAEEAEKERCAKVADQHDRWIGGVIRKGEE